MNLGLRGYYSPRGDEQPQCGAAGSSGCRKTSGPAAVSKAQYAVTTSWLECCLRDLLGPEVPVVRVCPPGSCSGHFDLSRGTLTDLQQCPTLFLFDFQQAMDDKLIGLKEAGLKLAPIKTPQGLCVPASYLAGCQAVRDVLAVAQPDTSATLAAALDRTRRLTRRLKHMATHRALNRGVKKYSVM